MRKIEVVIPPDVWGKFLDFVFNYADFAAYLEFDGVYVVARDADALLVNLGEVADEEEDRSARAAFRAKKPLPSGYYAIDEAVARNAFREGIKWGGIKWAEHPKCDPYTWANCFVAALGLG